MSTPKDIEMRAAIRKYCEDRACKDCKLRDVPKAGDGCYSNPNLSSVIALYECLMDESNTAELPDSGDRTQFATGAVRDMHEGKGRCDLIPGCVMLRLAKHYEAGAKKYDDNNWKKGIPAHSFLDSALRHIFKYMDGRTDEDHLIAAVWNLVGLAWTEEKKPQLMDILERQEAELAKAVMER